MIDATVYFLQRSMEDERQYLALHKLRWSHTAISRSTGYAILRDSELAILTKKHNIAYAEGYKFKATQKTEQHVTDLMYKR